MRVGFCIGAAFYSPTPGNDSGVFVGERCDSQAEGNCQAERRLFGGQVHGRVHTFLPGQSAPVPGIFCNFISMEVNGKAIVQKWSWPPRLPSCKVLFAEKKN